MLMKLCWFCTTLSSLLPATASRKLTSPLNTVSPHKQPASIPNLSILNFFGGVEGTPVRENNLFQEEREELLI
jgi:hypothetical protein